MRAIALEKHGPEGLTHATLPAPVPGPGEVLLRVHAAALNYRDHALVCSGYGRALSPPFVLGSDGAGEVLGTGPGANRFRIGERVVAHYVVDWISGEATEETTRRRLGGPLDGTFAELVVVPEHALVRLPESLSFAHAAALPVAGVTAYRALFGPTRLAPGDTVLIHGTGGVATFAIQLAAAAGLRCIVTSGSEQRLAAALKLGATHGIHRAATPDWDTRVLELTDGRGADRVLELAGGDSLARSVRASRMGGTVLVIGFLAGLESTLSLPEILRKQIELRGISVGSRGDLERLVGFYAAGPQRPVLDRTIDLAEVPEAIRALGAAGPFGKITVRVRDGE
ncbi:MAG: NAD(P)-dependent alcohol dehydrogenase [Polyangia bacterium]